MSDTPKLTFYALARVLSVPELSTQLSPSELLAILLSMERAYPRGNGGLDLARVPDRLRKWGHSSLSGARAPAELLDQIVEVAWESKELFRVVVDDAETAFPASLEGIFEHVAKAVARAEKEAPRSVARSSMPRPVREEVVQWFKQKDAGATQQLTAEDVSILDSDVPLWRGRPPPLPEPPRVKLGGGYTISVDDNLYRALLAVPPSAGLLTDFDLLYVAFALVDPRGASSTESSTLPEMTVDDILDILERYGYSPSARRGGLGARLLAAALEEPHFAVDKKKRRIHIARYDGYKQALSNIFVRDNVQDIWNIPEQRRPPPLRVYRVWLRGSPAGPEGSPFLDITAQMLNALFLAPKGVEPLSDSDLLVLAQAMETGLDPRASARATVRVRGLVHEIQKHSSVADAPIPNLAGRLRAAARATRFLKVISDDSAIRVQDADAFDDALRAICLRPDVQAFFALYRARHPLSRIRTQPQSRLPPEPPRKPIQKPAAKPPKEAPRMPPELPPPPSFMPHKADIARISADELLETQEDVVIPRFRLERDPVRPAHAGACAARFALRNGLCEIGEVTMTATHYLVARIFFAVDANEHKEGLALVIVADDGGEPDESVDLSEVHPTSESIGFDVGLTTDMASWVAPRIRDVLERAAQPWLRDAAQDHAREYARVVSRFAALAATLDGAGASENPGTQIERLARERASELDALDQRYAAKVSFTRIDVSWIELPAAAVAVSLRRRKAARTLTLRVPSGARHADSVACEACGRAKAGELAVCDGQMHLLCKTCVPNALGRITCPVCG